MMQEKKERKKKAKVNANAQLLRPRQRASNDGVRLNIDTLTAILLQYCLVYSVLDQSALAYKRVWLGPLLVCLVWSIWSIWSVSSAHPTT